MCFIWKKSIIQHAYDQITPTMDYQCSELFIFFFQFYPFSFVDPRQYWRKMKHSGFFGMAEVCEGSVAGQSYVISLPSQIHCCKCCFFVFNFLSFLVAFDNFVFCILFLAFFSFRYELANKKPLYTFESLFACAILMFFFTTSSLFFRLCFFGVAFHFIHILPFASFKRFDVFHSWFF